MNRGFKKAKRPLMDLQHMLTSLAQVTTFTSTLSMLITQDVLKNRPQKVIMGECRYHTISRLPFTHLFKMLRRYKPVLDFLFEESCLYISQL